MSVNIISKNSGYWIYTLFLLGSLNGLAMQTRGPLFLSFQQTFSVSEGTLGFLPLAATFSFSISVLIVGLRTSEINSKKFLLIGAGSASVFYFLMGASLSFFLLLLFSLGAGAAAGISRGLCRPMLSHEFPEERGRIFNLFGIAISVGSVLGPIFVNFVLGLGSWRWVYFLLSLFFFSFSILISKTRTPKSMDREKNLTLERLGEILKGSITIRITIILFLIGGILGGMYNWLPYYMSSFFSREIANLSLSGFVVAFIPGRYTWSLVSERINNIELILFNSIATFMLFFSFALKSGFLLLSSVFAIGFLISGIFPTLLAVEMNISPRYSGLLNSLALASAAMGMSLFPMIMGIIAESYSLADAMRLLIVLMGAVVCLLLLLKSSIENRKD